jgi:hypothetical protein
MFEWIKSIDRVSKTLLGGTITDSAKKEALAYFIRKQLGEDGEVVSVELDTTQKTAFIDLKLQGEHENVQVYIDKYSVEVQGERIYVIIEQARVSRKWLQTIVSRLLPYRLSIPEEYSAVAGAL